MKRTKLTDEYLAQYWARRVEELEAMRPITQAEAEAEAEAAEAEAERYEIFLADLKKAEQYPPYAGCRSISPSVLRSMQRDNHRYIGSLRRDQFGLATFALQARDKAASLRRLAAEPIGSPLAKSLAEARQRRDHYQRLADQKI